MIKATTRPVWEVDGELFDNERSAVIQDAILRAKEEAPGFLERSDYQPGTGYTRARNVVLAWVADQAGKNYDDRQPEEAPVA